MALTDTLQFFRQNGLDQWVDGYGVHVYPAADPGRLIPSLIAALNKDAFAFCTAAKPCWLTEWGFDNLDTSCPVDEQTRIQLIETMRGALQWFAKRGLLAGAFYYSWAGHPGEVGSTIFRCGVMTKAGELALRPM